MKSFEKPKKPGLFLRTILPAMLLALLIPPLDATAADWNKDYGISLSVGRDDNFRLSETDELETTTSRASVFANLDASTEISETGVSLSASGNSYSESEIDDSTTYRVALYTSRSGERLSGNLDLAFANQSTTETELLDTGAVIDGERETVSVSPGLQYRLDERNTLTASLAAVDVTYDTVSLTEYTDNSVSLGWRYQYDEASSYTATLRSSEYDPEDDDVTDINSLKLGYELDASETTRYSLSIGYSDVDRPRDSETGSNFMLGIDHQADERNSFSATVGSDYQTSGAGEVRDEDQLSLQWGHALSERTSLNATVTGIRNDDRDYASVSFGGNYQFSREIGLGADLRYREQDSDFSEADSASLFLSLTYSPI